MANNSYSISGYTSPSVYTTLTSPLLNHNYNNLYTMSGCSMDIRWLRDKKLKLIFEEEYELWEKEKIKV